MEYDDYLVKKLVACAKFGAAYRIEKDAFFFRLSGNSSDNLGSIMKRVRGVKI